MRNAAINMLTELARKDKNIILISGDLGFGVLDEFRTEMPDQYFNAGICEQNMASLAAGLALEGKKVYIYSIGNFPTLRCIEQIRNDICYHNVNVTILAVGGGFAYGSLGMSHHATEDIAMLRCLPNMMVFAPADAVEAQIILCRAAEMSSPCYIRLNKGGELPVHQSVDTLRNYKIGEAISLTEGFDICLMVTGAITIEATEAAKELEKKGVSVAVYSFPSIKPIDKNVIQRCAEKYEYIFTIEEHNVMGGFGSAVSEVVAEVETQAKVVRMGLNDRYSGIVGTQSYLRQVYGMDSKAIVEEVMKRINN